MKKRILSFMLMLAMLASILPQVIVSADGTAQEDVAYLFAYFTGNEPEQERMYYGISTDGYNFTAINGGNPVYTNPVGTGCLRDPYIFEGEDGKFYALATDMKSSLGWASNRSIITMVSDDLINWETNLIPVTTLFDSMSAADRVWAPQAIYDNEKQQYMIYLAIRTQDGGDNGGKTLMYRCWTEDFKTITEPELMFVPEDGSSAIDGDIIYSESEDIYYMYYKNENTARLYTATAASLSDTFVPTGTMLPCNNSAGNEAGVEGPAAYKLIGQDTYNIIYDAYGEGFFVMSQTNDHKNFTQLDQSKYSFNFTPRHGYVITINQAEYDKLMKTYGGDDTVRLNPADASPFNNGEFQGWGTSMGWWGNRIGYSDTLAQSAAELFYSDEGLGLDIVRYNVGGGDDPTHDHITRSDSKMPCFLNQDGTYNWEADHNQVNVLTRIKQQNDNVHIEGYTNSPPWFMTISG
ncbi:MAG: glycoside hydrolase, partial [Hominilimicola sp.]